MCHDEPREPAKGGKQQKPENPAVVKQEASPYIVGPAINQQPSDPQLLHDGTTTLGSEIADEQMDTGRDPPQLLNPIQGQTFESDNQTGVQISLLHRTELTNWPV